MTTVTDAQLKARHRAMWASGDYPAVAEAVIPDLGAVLVDACGVRRGDRVLDVAAGAGNAAIPAALAGATVVAADLTPELVAAGRRAARARGAELTWQVADAEDLPFGDASFDVVLSCVGVMFASDHDASARELLRVCRPGGVIGLISWTPAGFIGQLLAAMKPYAPAPPPGARPALRWGEARYVRELLGDSVREFRGEHRAVRVDRLAGPEELRDLFKTAYGPVVAVYRGLGGDAGRIAALDRDVADLARRHDLSPRRPAEDPQRGRTPIVMDWEYLLVTAVRGAP